MVGDLFKAASNGLVRVIGDGNNHWPLIYDREKQELISRSARLAYPIRDGIPVMLEEEARKVSPEEYEDLKP